MQKNRKASSLILVFVICFVIAMVSFSTVVLLSNYSTKLNNKKEALRSYVYD